VSGCGVQGEVSERSEESRSRAPVLYVAVGASAGGLEAIESFFGAMPPDTGMGFVVVQHLSPDYKSLMVEILSKKTSMRVRRAEEGMAVERDGVYLIPPKASLTIRGGKLYLLEQAHVKGVLNLPIDTFMRSLAEDQREKAVGVVLSGSGSDGMRGVRAVKECGGMVMVQREDTARFEGMPQSAISTGLADYVLPPSEMPQRLVEYARHPFVSPSPAAGKREGKGDGLGRILAQLREAHNVDFGVYKPGMVLRRIERRMAIHGIDGLDGYAQFLRAYPGESATLYRDLLIGVTRFFRDGEAFAALAERWLDGALGIGGEAELRFWVAGCSTGEEAYSLAVLARERMERTGRMRRIKIFATDVDRDALQFAAAGTYPDSIAADVPPDLLHAYFSRANGVWQVARHVREMVVFARHNLVKDPPFTRIDLATCRNLLIYLQPPQQRKALEYFNYSLNPGGALLLGASEGIGELDGCFETLDARNRLYVSKGRSGAGLGMGMVRLGPDGGGAHLGRMAAREEENPLLERLLEALKEEVPLCVVVNENLQAVHLVGDSRDYFRLPAGRQTTDLVQMAAKELAVPLSTGLRKAFRTGEPIRFGGIRMARKGGSVAVELRIRPLPRKRGQEALAAVVVAECGEAGPETGSCDLAGEMDRRLADMEHELRHTRENLQAAVEEMETANEELQATNEELLASNEELQSTNEELQSTNEELYSVNAEYQAKIMELGELRNDVENLLGAGDAAQILLDENLEIRRFSRRAKEVYRLVEADVGRRLDQVAHRVVDGEPLEVVAESVEKGKRVERELRTDDGHRRLMRAAPYEVGPGVHSGVLVSFVDVSRLLQGGGAGGDEGEPG
jgi:two-component system, chemotaxis family, CheB/CheR fusion protein